MKIDRSKIKRSTTEVPPDCKILIDRLKSCDTEEKIISVLKTVKTWTFGKCELYHWIDVLDLFDSKLQKATERCGTSWVMACDVNDSNGPQLQECVERICCFTSLLIEHSFSRTLYNSMEHLTALLNSTCLPLVLEVLHLLYMFSKRSNFLTRLSEEKRDLLLERLIYLAESWGGKEAGFGLAACCLDRKIEEFPSTATAVHLEFLKGGTDLSLSNRWKQGDMWTVVHLKNVDKIQKSPAEILDELIEKYAVPVEKQLILFTHIRLAWNFPVWEQRVKLVQARLQAISILVYANAIQDNTQQLLYSGLMEELVDVLELDKPYLKDIKAAALKTLTSIIHLDRAQNFPNIIDATGAGSYHGFLPVMVRSCIASLTNPKPEDKETYPLPLATALFSFLYHLASYELGGEALVNCGMLESLLKVVNWNTVDVEHITFVTRAVRVIDLITNMDMQAFQAHNGLAAFINRLEMEVNACRKDQPFEIIPRGGLCNRQQSIPGQSGEDSREGNLDTPMDTDGAGSVNELTGEMSQSAGISCSAAAFLPNGTACLPQRAALLKSMLNFLKKVIQDPAFSDGIRHLMEGSLPNSLKHIISNAEYYGPSLFLLATDVVTVYVFQEPSLLSTLQDSGLTDVVSEALLVKDVPPTREVISSMPNVFSALCLNSRGLNAFIKYNPFRKLFRILISPEYLPAMRRRRTAEPMGDTASNLGNAMDELMRHQPSLRIAATSALVELLNELFQLGSTTRPFVKSLYKPVLTSGNTNARSGASEGGSSDDEEEDEEETSTASHSQPPASSSSSRDEVGQENPASSAGTAGDEKAPVPFMDYVLNVMKCLDAILSNNSTDDHCREFVNQGGLNNLTSILLKPTLPIDFPNSPACQATSSVCRSILTLAHEGEVLNAGINGLLNTLVTLEPLEGAVPEPGSSVLLRELARSKNPLEAINDCSETPLLHAITSVHSLVMMFIHVCRTGQSDIRQMVVGQWGSSLGLNALKRLSTLYLNLVWESTVLLSLCSGEYQPGTNEFGRKELDKLIPPELQKETEVSIKSARDVDLQQNNQDSSTSQVSSDRTGYQDTSGSGWTSNSSVQSENMDVDGDSNSTTQPLLVNSSTQTIQQPPREINNLTLQNYAKLIKPILSASSRLGRALAELFGLLVKLCVGSPLRQRRGHHLPQVPGMIIPGATQVATVLSELLTCGLRWVPRLNSPVPRITFSICAVGFSAPLLFDEKKFPYHLMLRKFMEAKGLDALFEIFYWAMTESYVPKQDSSEAPVNEHQMEFLESWLTLVEKFSNPKTILDQNQLSKAVVLPKSANFEPPTFLAHVHKKAFEAVIYLWRKYDLRWFSPRSVETMLTILCHIFRFKDQAKPATKLTNAVLPPKEEVPAVTVTETAVASPSEPGSSRARVAEVVPNEAPTTEGQGESHSDEQAASGFSLGQLIAQRVAEVPPSELEVLQTAETVGLDPSHLQQLVEMGFPIELCVEALVSTASIVQATDFLLSHSSGVSIFRVSQMGNRNVASQPASSAFGAVEPFPPPASLSRDVRNPFTMDWNDLEDQRTVRLMMALGDKQGKSQHPSKLKEAVNPSKLEPLQKEEVDRFTETVLEQCLVVLDKIPDCVFRVCELLVAVGQRNGVAWMEKSLYLLISEITEGMKKLSRKLRDDERVILDPDFNHESKPLAHRIHLFTLMFEEVRYVSSMILEKTRGIAIACQLLVEYDLALNFDDGEGPLKHRLVKKGVLKTPNWLAPMLLMVDLYEKASIASRRRLGLSEETDHEWRWYDINSGKWCNYSVINNNAIDKAFWEGDSTVRITAGRRRYVINFNAMIQLNEETSNRRPITLWLKSTKEENDRSNSPNASREYNGAVTSDSDSDMFLELERSRILSLLDRARGNSSNSNSRMRPRGGKKGAKVERMEVEEEKEIVYVKRKLHMFQGLVRDEVNDLIKCSVSFMKCPVEPEFLHAVMRLCLRLTRNYEIAVMFSNLGGVQVLLELTQGSGFPGFLPLSNLLIRHVIEDPNCLRYAIEKMIRAKALSTGASTCKELHYLLRVLAPIACRSPELFVKVTKEILRVDLNFVTRREDDLRLIVKPVPCKPENLKTFMGETAKSVIQQLLVALTMNQNGEEEGVKEDVATTSPTKRSNAQQTNQSAESDDPMESDASKANKPKDAKNDANELLKKRKLIPKFAICQLLAESVHSYSYSCKIIAEYSFQGGASPHVPEDCTALAFLLDKMLPTTQTVSEKDCSSVVRDLISAMAGCNHLPDAQAIVISEFKASLQRALAMRECAEKHNRIQALAGLINYMIEACPSGPPTQMVSAMKPTHLCMNQVVRLLIRKNVVVDLARITHSLDLSSFQMAATVNAALKPLELISRIVNQPLPTHPTRPKPKTESAGQDSINNTHTGGTSNSEMTHAQGEETIEDADNTEHDISAAAESLLDATSESHTQDHDANEERDDDVLDEIMDQLLERENAQNEERIIAEAIIVEAAASRMETEQDVSQRESRDYGEGRYGVDHDENDTSGSESDPSDGDDDDDDEDGNGNNVGEEDDDDEEEEEEDDDDDDVASNFDDREQELLDEGFMRLPGMDRDEDLLVVQYGQDENTPVFFSNNASYNLNVGLFDDPLVNEHPSGLRLNHPLLTPPATDPPVAGSVNARGHRTGRARRYQYIHFPRNPPAVIQRLLGPSTAQEVIQLTSGQSLNQGIRDQARVLVMDASSDQTVARNGTPGSSNCLANYTALHWWCEEAKALDGESMHDCVISIKRQIVDAVEQDRDKAFKLRREKKAKDAEELKKKTDAAKSAAAAAAATEAATDSMQHNVADTSTSTILISRTTTDATPATTAAPSTSQAGADTVLREPRPADFTIPGAICTNPEGLLPYDRVAYRQALDQYGIEHRARLRREEDDRQPEGESSNASVDDRDVEQQEVTDMDLERLSNWEAIHELAADQVNLLNVRRPSGRGRRPSGGVDRRGRRPGLRSHTRAAASGGENNPPNLTDSPPVLQPQVVQADSNAVRTDNSAPVIVAESAAQSNIAQGGTEPVAGPSGTQQMEDYRNVLGDIDIPDGVDPSFLAALPEDMRQEVIAEHIRLQRLRERAQVVSQEATTVPVADVSPEFLAALPPNIQEEVLAQQRIEQQRRVATASNPNDPVDTEAFFRNLQPSLRQAILADMEESQIAVLPPDLAAEAQNLRREWESRNRQLLQDRFFSHNHHASTTLSSILRNSGILSHNTDNRILQDIQNFIQGMRLSSRYGLHNVAQRNQWSNQWPRTPTAINSQHLLMSAKIKGKQLVDNETLSCLLVLLFLDDPRLNTGRLNRVLRNLCYHANTRQWVIRSLLSVMERASECSVALPAIAGSSSTPGQSTALVRKSQEPVTSMDSSSAEKQMTFITPSWLNISLDAALGCRASVFEIHKNCSMGGKKTGAETRIISIHAQAVPSISRHTLDVLTNLAKSFPSQFLPSKSKPSLYCLESGSKLCNLVERKPPTPPPELKPKMATSSCGKPKSSDGAEFWDLLLKLDTAGSSRKGKNIVKGQANTSLNIDLGNCAVSFEMSPFGQLISMLSFGCVRRSSLLTDKLLRLLSLISLGIPDTSGFGRKVVLEEPEAPQDTSVLITESHLRLIVEVITSKSCSEEGLEEATSLLLNLSYGPPSTRDKILNLLMEGVRELGSVVCGHISSLQHELRAMRKDSSVVGDVVDEVGSSNTDSDDKMFKGTLVDRFTKDMVVIQSTNKAKAAYELQLPSMAALTSKTSSQAFFLRLLKVIISLREAIRLAIKKHKQKGGNGSADAPLMSSTIMTSMAEGSLVSAVTSGMSESASQRLREAFRRVVNSDMPEEQPMDVDQELTDGPEVRPSRRSGFSSLVGIDESSDEGEEQVEPTEKKETVQTKNLPESKDVSTIDESKLLPRLSSLLDLDKLWETLSQCLQELGHTPDHHAVLVLQPAVEAFFLVHASVTDKEEKKSNVRESREAQLAHLQQDLPPVSPIQAGDTEMFEPLGSGVLELTQSSSVTLSPDTQKFLQFAETHRTVLNQILRQSTTHLADGPFAVLVDHTRVLDFDVKRRYFRTELERLDEGVRREDLAVHVRRSNVFEDSFRELHRRAAEEWKNRFYIVFEGEEGQDAGGLLREWYVIISREIFNPMYALFTISPGDRVTYMINPSSHCNSNHLFYFKFVGRVIAKAIYDNKLLECYFTRSFYKHILGKSVKYTDMESEDYSFYQGLAFLIENTVVALGYELTYSTEVQEFGVTEIRDLIQNGRNIAVTEENKMEYIRLVCQMKMTGAIRKQLNAFLEGFYDIIPKRLISIFNEQELELLVSGLPNVDIEDLKSNTEYHKYQPTSLQIQWFWRALRSFDQADRAKFLQFVTGTSKVPLQGFGALEGMNGVQKFQIHRDDRSTDRLPSAHTCFNQLDLPAYETYDKLRSYLMKAIHECSEGFGFA